MEDATSSSDRETFGTVSFNSGSVTAGFGASKSIDWYVTTVSSAAGTFGLEGAIVVKSNDSAVVELKRNLY